MTALSDLERIRSLFSALEKKEALARLLEAAETAEGVQIYIGAESELFGLSGCSLVVAPYRNGQQRIVGAVGRHRPDPHRLCPGHTHGGLHRPIDRPNDRLRNGDF